MLRLAVSFVAPRRHVRDLQLRPHVRVLFALIAVTLSLLVVGIAIVAVVGAGGVLVAARLVLARVEPPVDFHIALNIIVSALIRRLALTEVNTVRQRVGGLAVVRLDGTCFRVLRRLWQFLTSVLPGRW